MATIERMPTERVPIEHRRVAASPGLLFDRASAEAAPISPLERSRSAMWPLALALIVGMALGFGAGYSVANRDRSLATITAADVTAPPQQPAPPGREWTDSAVPDAPKAKAAPAPAPPPSKPEAVGTTGRLLVRSTPAGARVFVDGRDLGRTPLTLRDVSHGAHRVRLVQEGYTTEERRVVISTGKPAQSIVVPLTRTAPAPSRAANNSFNGSLTVESRPAGAKVSVDGKLVGTTPLMLPQIAAGSHAVQLEHDGYRRWSSSVRVVSGERNRITASLEEK
jgi:hypothetical protein